MDKVRIGIIGIGGMGSNHAGYLSKGEVPGGVLTAVADVSPARLDWAKGALGEDVTRFDDPEQLLASGKVDGVMIATPHYHHPTLGIKALEAGLHVLCEKPAGVYTKQVRAMNEAAAASDKLYAIMFNQRTRPVHQKVKEIVDSGELGEIVRVVWVITDWFRSQAYYDGGGWRATWAGEGGGVLINQCPHNIDLWQWFCGMPKRVRAFCQFGAHHDIEVEDDVTCYVEYPNGATGLFITSTGEAPGRNRLEISGDRGMLTLEGGKLTFVRTEQSVREFIKTSTSGFGRPETWRCEIPSQSRADEHRAVTRAWASAILKGTPLIADGAEGIKSLELSNAMHLSAWTDGWVDLPIDEDLYWQHLQQKIAESDYNPEAPDKVMDVEGTFG